MDGWMEGGRWRKGGSLKKGWCVTCKRAALILTAFFVTAGFASPDSRGIGGPCVSQPPMHNSTRADLRPALGGECQGRQSMPRVQVDGERQSKHSIDLLHANMVF
eukprot:2246989-Rhodomonas_salina.1